MTSTRTPAPSPSTALVLGGGSDIALATVRRLADEGLRAVVLAVRDPAALQARLDADPLPLDAVHLERWDANDVEGHRPLLVRASAELGTIDLVL